MQVVVETMESSHFSYALNTTFLGQTFCCLPYVMLSPHLIPPYNVPQTSV